MGRIKAMLKERFLVIICWFFFSLLFSQSLLASPILYLSPLEGGKVEVKGEISKTMVNFYLLRPGGRRESLLVQDGLMDISLELEGDYRLYGDYSDLDQVVRTKILFSTPARERTYREALGGGFLEILPLQPPEAMKKDGSFTGRVVRDGTSLEGVRVKLLERENMVLSLVTDKDGVFTFPLKHPGIYVVTATISFGGPLFFSSYTLHVFDDTRERALFHYLLLLLLLVLFLLFLIRYFKKMSL